MVNYKIVKYCRMCSKRFVVEKGQVRVIYCPECQKKALVDKEKKAKN